MKLKIKDFREYAGLTQKQLASMLNISQGAISSYELGTRQPDLETLEKLASIFNIPIDSLFGQSKKELYIITKKQYDALIKMKEIIESIEHNNSKKNIISIGDNHGEQYNAINLTVNKKD